MKLKHYLGALLMAGSVVAISFPADANPGLRLGQRWAPQLVKRLAPSFGKTISKANIRATNLLPRAQVDLIKTELMNAKSITDKITMGSKVPVPILTPDITSELPQLASPPPVVASPSSVVPTQPTVNEEELKQHTISRSVIGAGGIIKGSIGAFVLSNSKNVKSEKPQIQVSEVHTSGAGKSLPILFRKSIR